MTNEQRFLYLFQRHLDDLATDEEQYELARMVNTGTYDHLVKNQIDDLLAESGQADLQDMSSWKARDMIRKILEGEPAKQTKKKPSLRPVAKGDLSEPDVFSGHTSSKRYALTARWMAVAAAILVAVVSIWWILQQVTPAPGTAWYEQAIEPAAFSGKQYIRLQDGSTVLLNEHSELSYTESFGDGTREIQLTGEGYFNIEQDPKRPFIVSTNDVTTTVVGTTFNVRAYPEDREVSITVVDGEVAVGNPNREHGTINRNQQIAVNTVTMDFVQADVLADTVTQWTQAFLIFDDVNMEEAAQIMNERYNVTVTVPEELKQSRVSATFVNSEELEEVLMVLCGVLNADYEKLENGNYEILK